MKKITLWLFALFACWQINAQVSSYGFSEFIGTYTDNSASATQLTDVNVDTGISSTQNIGFDFVYAGVTYTQFKMSSNGFISFNIAGTSSLTTNDLSAANATSRPIIAPLWDDHAGSTVSASAANYELTGVAPNRVLTVEWKNWEWNYSATAAVISFQVKLYETTNVIDFVYRQEAAPISGTVSASIGLGSASGSGAGSYLSLSSIATPAVSSTTSTNSLNTKPATGQVYRFTPPSCAAPAGVAASAVTANSATISWNVANPVPSNGYEYYIDTVNTAPTGSGTPEATTSVNVSSLAANTTYYVWVRSDCGGNFSAWSPVYSFTTLCATFPAPYAEGFENAGTIPSCWTMSGSENWRFSNTGSGNHIGNNGTITGSTISGGYFAWIDDSSPDTSDATLTSPLIDVSTLTSPTLFFYELSDNEGANPNSTLNVEVWDGTAWNAVATYNTNTNGWVERVISLSSLTITGDIRVRFIMVESSSFYDDIAIDDVRIDEAPTCFAPTGLAVSNVTTNTADLTWADGSGGAQFDFYYVIQPQGTGTAGITVENYYDYSSGVPFTATCTDISDCANTLLTPNTAYEIYVRADCSSNWVGPITFTTECAVYSVPATEDFTTYVPACWEEADNGDLVAGPASFGSSGWSVDGFGNVGTTGAFKYNIFTTGANDWVLTPLFDIPTTGYELKFDAAAAQYNTTSALSTPWESDDFVEVLVSTGTTNWTVLYTYNDTNVPSNTGTTNIINLDAYAGQTVRFAYRVVEGATNGSADIDFSIDNFEIRLTPVTPPTCATNVVATPDASCGNFSTVITWDASSGADGYYLTIGTTSGGNQVLDNQDLGSALTYSFAGNANTTYYFTVSPYNGNGAAAGCSEVSFTTAATGCYCISNPTSVDGQGITNVQIVTTDFANTVNSSPVYNDHTATVVDMAQGINNNVQISFDTGFGFDYNIVIWIDANDDFNLDASEIVYTGLAPNTPIITFDASFVVPNSVPLGQHRMRIIATDALQTPSNPCYSGTWGETADFTINVIAATCVPPTVDSSTLVADCANSQFSVDVVVSDLGDTTAASITDGTNSWPVAATGTINVGPFADGSSVTLTLLHGTDNTCDLPLGTFTNVCPPANDDCSNAFVVTMPYTFTQDASAATNNAGFITSCTNTMNDGVWYTVVGDGGDITIDVTGVTGWDPQIDVYTGSCGAFTCVGSADSGGTGGSEQYTIIGSSVGVTYYINIGHYSGFTDSPEGPLTIDVSSTLSTNTFNSNEFVAYPNPVKDVLTLEYSSDITDVNVINMLGQVVLTRTVNATSAQVDMSQLNAGAYLVSVKMGDVEKTIKVVKQ